ncbi:MAG: hypothetical protein WC069_03865 [Candidatus Shapirobacteria bacterium]
MNNIFSHKEKISPHCINCLRGGQCGASHSVNDRATGLDLVCGVVAHTSIGQNIKTIVFAEPLKKIIVDKQITIPRINTSKTEPRKTVFLQSWNFEKANFETVVAINRGDIIKPTWLNKILYRL